MSDDVKRKEVADLEAELDRMAQHEWEYGVEDAYRHRSPLPRHGSEENARPKLITQAYLRKLIEAVQVAPRPREADARLSDAIDTLYAEIEWLLAQVPPVREPKIMQRDEFVRLLEGLINLIKADDSAEGRLEYRWGQNPPNYEVEAFLRTGNSMGQGGSIII